MKTKLILGMVLLLGLSIGANAQYAGGKNPVQRERIAQGMRSGSLTKGEAYKLSKEQHRLHRKARRYKHNDGHLSRHERKQLRRDHRVAGRHIHHYKHNGQHRRFS
jgi:hypothetical protein